MPIKLHELNDADDNVFASITAVESDSFHNPYYGFWHVFNGPSPEELAERQLSWHKSDPTSHWIYVTDEETGEVIAAAQWNVHPEGHFAKASDDVKPYWMPEGTTKDVASQLLHQFFSLRRERMNESHLLISFCFTHSKHRRRGAAALLMEWGTRKADELGLPAYVEATDNGRELYKQYGFEVKGEVELDATTDNPTQEFNASREKFRCPTHAWFMVRPKPERSG